MALPSITPILPHLLIKTYTQVIKAELLGWNMGSKVGWQLMCLCIILVSLDWQK